MTELKQEELGRHQVIIRYEHNQKMEKTQKERGANQGCKEENSPESHQKLGSACQESLG